MAEDVDEQDEAATSLLGKVDHLIPFPGAKVLRERIEQKLVEYISQFETHKEFDRSLVPTIDTWYDAEWKDFSDNNDANSDRKLQQSDSPHSSSVYFGSLDRNGLREGFGYFLENVEKINTPDCVYYIGLWKAGKRTGLGIQTYPFGEYRGSFENNLRCGNGTMTMKNGDSYQGCWLNDLRHGRGRYIFHDLKEIYDGNWVCGKREGIGMYVYANGSVYSGEWKDNVVDGEGVLTGPSLQRFEGHWKNGTRLGKGKSYRRCGSLIYDGEWENNCYHGKGKRFYSDGSVFEGNWVLGVKTDGVLTIPEEVRQRLGLEEFINKVNGKWKKDVLPEFHIYLPETDADDPKVDRVHKVGEDYELVSLEVGSSPTMGENNQPSAFYNFFSFSIFQWFFKSEHLHKN